MFKRLLISFITLVLVSCGGGNGTTTSSNGTVTPSSSTPTNSTPIASSYSLGGSVTSATGISPTGLVLTDGIDNITIAGSASTFTFPTSMSSSTAYTVSVKTNPGGVNCTITNGTGSGTISTSNVNSVTVNCAAGTVSALYTFKTGTNNTTGSANPNDGAFPQSVLVMDSLGNLYGTTVYGGGTAGAGTVFKLTPNSSGSYTESVLYRFQSSSNTDGASPQAGLVMDSSGNLYGTTYGGGTANKGTVFKLTLNPSSGSYTETVLYSFQSGVNTTVVGNSNDGANPYAGLVMDSLGNLYGTTNFGGTAGAGTVFKLTLNPSSGSYTESVLYSFQSGVNTTVTTTSNDGASPLAGLVMDSSGNLYGTTYGGGTANKGTVFKLTLNPSSGSYTETVLANGSTTYGANPVAGLIMDSLGNLYGTTYFGGTAGAGTVFKLTNNSGVYTESVIYSFQSGVNTTVVGNSNDGANPYAGLVMDSLGNLYGTTFRGGNANVGTVFKLTLNTSSSSYTESILANGSTTYGANPVAGLIMDSLGNLYGTTYFGGTANAGTVFKIN